MDRLGMLGSVDSNTGSPDLGWDTDQFPMDIRNTTLVMKVSSGVPSRHLPCVSPRFCLGSKVLCFAYVGATKYPITLDQLVPNFSPLTAG